jgi:peptidoglycan/xylan/chitin deacetylase (PgdA/CDA1 family)
MERIATGRSVQGACAITFDDGWHDNFTNAFPVLNKFQLPATVFLASGFIGTDRLFWPEELTYYLRQRGCWGSGSQNQVSDRFLSELGGNDSEETFLDNAVLALKAWSPNDRKEILNHLRTACTASPPVRLLMNWEEAREMQASGLISFGAHTANHVILDQVSQRKAEEEIRCSLQVLESRLGVRPEFFAYPNGNFNKGLQSILKRNGFKGAVTTRKGWVGEGVPLFEIPRIGMHEDVSRTTPLFFARILLKRF